MSRKIKVLIVDDSALFRKVIGDILESDPMIEVIGTANNGKSAVIKNQQLNPDVITMDIEMPIMDGLAALKEIVSTNPKPVVMMSVLTQYGADATFKALDIGAVDFVPKPSSKVQLTNEEIGELLISKVKNVPGYKLKISSDLLTGKHLDQRPAKEESVEIVRSFSRGTTSDKLIAMGTSTGGPSALLDVFQRFPNNFPSPVVVVQHMPQGFTRAFAERLNANSRLAVKEAEDGDKLAPGCGFIAPGNLHLSIEGKTGNRKIRIYDGDKVTGHKPSIDVLFHSVAETAGKDSIGVIMTGMGKDGAEGIMKIKEKGGYTFAQDEKTSVVYGMNRVAVQLGAINEIVPLNEITKKIVEHI